MNRLCDVRPAPPIRSAVKFLPSATGRGAGQVEEGRASYAYDAVGQLSPLASRPTPGNGHAYDDLGRLTRWVASPSHQMRL